MADEFDIQLDLSKLDELAKDVEGVGDEAVRMIAFEGLARSQKILTNVIYTRAADDDRPEPTGALRASGYVRSWKQDDTGTAESGAIARNPAITFGTVPPEPKGPGEAHILFAVEYAVYIEFGTRYMPARPFLKPAVASLEKMWEPTVKELLRRRGIQ